MRKHLSVLLSIVLFFSILVTTVSRTYASEVETYSVVLSDIQGTLSITFPKNTNVPLYYDEDTPITINWLKSNPDFVFSITPSTDGGSYLCAKVGHVGRFLELRSSKTFNYETFTKATTTTYPESSYDTQILLITSGVEGYSITPSGTITGGDSGGTVTPDDGSGGNTEDDKGFFESLVNGVKEAFTAVGEFIVNGLTTVINGIVTAIEWLWDLLFSVLDALSNLISSLFSNLFELLEKLFGGLFDAIKTLFSPIIEFFQDIVERREKGDSFFEAITESFKELAETVKKFTLDPILEFMESMDSEAVDVLHTIFEFPLIKEFLIGAVAILLVTSLLTLMMTL